MALAGRCLERKVIVTGEVRFVDRYISGVNVVPYKFRNMSTQVIGIVKRRASNVILQERYYTIVTLST